MLTPREQAALRHEVNDLKHKLQETKDLMLKFEASEPAGPWKNWFTSNRTILQAMLQRLRYYGR